MNEGRVSLLYLRLSHSKLFKCGHVLPVLKKWGGCPQLPLDDKTIKSRPTSHPHCGIVLCNALIYVPFHEDLDAIQYSLQYSLIRLIIRSLIASRTCDQWLKS